MPDKTDRRAGLEFMEDLGAALLRTDAVAAAVQLRALRAMFAVANA
jgi:hypothetical protein